jgi:hypothetical protein
VDRDLDAVGGAHPAELEVAYYSQNTALTESGHSTMRLLRGRLAKPGKVYPGVSCHPDP